MMANYELDTLATMRKNGRGRSGDRATADDVIHLSEKLNETLKDIDERLARLEAHTDG